jgi:hypothetical protein
LGFDNITFAAQYRISGVLKYFGRPPFGQPISDWKEEMPRTPSPYGRSKGKKKPISYIIQITTTCTGER